MIHPRIALRQAGNGIGYGVFATARLPRGTITWVMDELDQVIAPERAAALPEAYAHLLDKYTFRADDGRLILCWDFARFMNHSCAPTCIGTEYGFEVAVRDIEPGDELTVDYAALHLQPHEAFACRCGMPECRGWIGPADAERAARDGRGLIVRALECLDTVEQPLGHLVREADLHRACAAHNVVRGVFTGAPRNTIAAHAQSRPDLRRLRRDGGVADRRPRLSATSRTPRARRRG